MDTLRWILLILGVLVVAGLYGYYRWQDGQGGGHGRSRSRRPADHDVDAALRDLDDLVIDDPDSIDEVDLDLSVDDHHAETPPAWDDPDEAVSAPRVRPASRQERVRPGGGRETAAADAERDEAAEHDALRADPAWQDAGEKIVVLHVTAGRGYLFTGPALIDALERIGLRHGMHDIYHWMVAPSSGGTPMFSVANMLEPGHFDLEKADTMETPGVAMFMQLPAPFDGLTAFEHMLETARRLADELDGQLLDAQRCDLTAQAIEHIREDLREYRRKAHLAASKSRA